MKIELIISTYKTNSYKTNSDSASQNPSKMIPESSDEVLRARTAQALRAFLYPLQTENIQPNPEKIGHLCRRAFIVYQRCQALNLLFFAIKITLIKPQSERFA